MEEGQQAGSLTSAFIRQKPKTMKAWGIENGENLHMLNAAEWMVILNLSPCSSALHAFVFPLKFQIFSCALSKSVFCSPNFYAPYLFVAFRLLWRKQKDFRAQIPGSNQKKKDMPLTCVSQMLFSLSISLPLSVTVFFSYFCRFYCRSWA